MENKKDGAHIWTDGQISLLEQSFKDVYGEAQKEAEKRLNAYLEQFKQQDAAKRDALNNGEITQAEYRQWRKSKMLRQSQLKSTVNEMAKAYNNADTLAMRYLNNSLPTVLGANFDYGASEILGTKWSFKLYDQNTVNRLIAVNPDLLPKPRPNKYANPDWYKKKINSAITQGILHGDSIPTIAKQLNSVTNSGKAAAIRNARTAMTSAQNAGRVESYRMAEADGVDMVQIWLATLDNRTRHSHAAIDGEEIPVDGEFSNGLRYPGDPRGDPAEVYNCRCTITAHVKKYAQYHTRGVYGNGKLGDETYDQWKERHIQALEKKNGLTNGGESGTIKADKEMFRKKVYSARDNVKPVKKEVFEGLTLNAKQHGAEIIKCEYGDEWFLHLEKMGATASCIGTDAMVFRPDVTVSEVLEETYHFKQNLAGLNNDKSETLRTILNEIDAKQYVLNNAKKYSIPRTEIEEIQIQLKKYQQWLDEELKKG